MAAALGAIAILAGCSAPPAEAPVVHIAEAVQPSPTRALEKILPTQEELAAVLGSTGMMGQRVQGGPDMLLASVGEGDATPAECVSPTYRLQRVVYDAGPVQSVASQSWAGGSFDGPPVSGFFGVVQFSSKAAARPSSPTRPTVASLQRAVAGVEPTRPRRTADEQGHRCDGRWPDRIGDGDARRRFDDRTCARDRRRLCCGR